MWWPLISLVAAALSLESSQSICAQQVLGNREFLSLDCGGNNSNGFIDDHLPDIRWQADSDFVPTGSVGKVADASQVSAQFQSVRYFPASSSPTKNCFLLPTTPPNNYLIRAGFLYGNYDGQQSSDIHFQIALDSTPWVDDVAINGRLATTTSTVSYFEAITAPTQNSTLSVCLIRTDDSTPFINTLELRQIGIGGYTGRLVDLRANLRLVSRINFGERHALSPLRYPADPVDRIWPSDVDALPGVGGIPVTAGPGYFSTKPPPEAIPGAIMRSGIMSPRVTYTRPVKIGADIFTLLGCQELNSSLGPLDRRVIDIEFSSDSFQDRFSNQFLHPYSEFTINAWGYTVGAPTGQGNSSYSVIVTRNPNSTLDALVNIDELYYLQRHQSGTNPVDVDALAVIKRTFNFSYWVGDPCKPAPWDELSCSTSDGATDFRVTSLNLSGKYLTGLIPVSNFTALTSLTTINLSNNSFSGPLPQALQNLTDLTVLNLANNQLTGSLEYSWLQHLTNLDVSNNLLDGTFPATLVSNLGSKFRYSGNPLLQCYPVNNAVCPVPGLFPPTPQNTQPTSPQSSKLNIVPIVASGVGGVAVIVAIVVGVTLWYTKIKDGRCATFNRQSGSFKRGPGHILVRGKEVGKHFTPEAVIKATNSFAQKLGEGGFGPVYYGVLQNKQEVAVKTLSGKTRQGSEEFYNEVALLYTVSHKNLVCLVGYCNDPPDLKLLYEFMPGGDLRQRLYGTTRTPPLSWQQRLNIALDAANGILYLHEGCNPSIIHRDVKTSNILLTSSMEAKLADFGISKLKSEDKSHVTTRVIGTPGYLDPEYQVSGFLTHKCDVYSFGVVLLEILCGRQALLPDTFSTADRFIVQRVKNAVNAGSVDMVVDPNLGGQYPAESLWRLVELAMRCTRTTGSARPNMRWVVKELSQIVEKSRNPRPTSSDGSAEHCTDEPLSPGTEDQPTAR